MNTTSTQFKAEPRTPERDEEIIALAKTFFADKQQGEGEVFNFFLDRGASLEMLEQLAIGWPEDTDETARIRSLPYTTKLLQAGFAADEVARFVVRQCFGARGGFDSGSRHRQQIIAFRCNWVIFKDARAFEELFLGLAEHEAEKILFEEMRESLAIYIGQLQEGDNRAGTGFRPDKEAKLRAAGMPAAERIMAKAAANLLTFADSEQMQFVQSLPLSAQVAAAKKVIPNEKGLPFRISVLLSAMLRRDDEYGIMRGIYESFERAPHRAAALYRWALLGAKQSGRETEFRVHLDDRLRTCVLQAGWRFERLIARQNPRRDEVDLQFEFTEAGTKVVVKHEPRGLRNEVMKEGDEVIVPKNITKDRTPVFQSPDRKFRVFAVELQHAAPPTGTMQSDPRSHFHLPAPKEEGRQTR